METDTLEEFDKDQFLEYSRLTTNNMLLAVTLDTSTMTMTSFASPLGSSFLQQSVQYAGLDFLDELQDFLSDHYKTKKLKIENKSLKDESNDEDQKKTVRDRKRKQEGSPFITDKKQKVAEKDLNSMSSNKDMTRLTSIQTDNAMSRSGRKIKTPKWLLGNEISVSTGNDKNIYVTKARLDESADQIQSSISRTSSVLKNVNKSEATNEKINPNKTSLLKKIVKEIKVEIEDKGTSQESNKNNKKEELADSINKQDVNKGQNTKKNNNTQDTTDNGNTQNVNKGQNTKKNNNTQDTTDNGNTQNDKNINSAQHNKDDDIDQQIKGFGNGGGNKVTDNETEIKVESCEKEANDKNKILEIQVEDNGQDENLKDNEQDENHKDNGQDENHTDKEQEKLKSNDSDEKHLHWAYGAAIDCEDKMKETKGIFKCRKCDEEMSSSLERVRHEVNDHNLIVMLKMIDRCAKPFKCPLCRRCMKFEESMRTHIIIHTTIDVTDLTCSVCKLLFINKIRLRDHMLTHGEAKFPCPNCGKKFRMEKYVRRHMICCSKVSADKNEVNEHNFIGMLKMKDHCAKPFKCPLCRRCMKFEESMRTHIVEHATADVTDLTCSVCKLQFINKLQLRDHMLTHGEAKFPCPNCGKKFRMKKYVRRHMIESCCSKVSADKEEDGENELPAQADTSIDRNLAVNNSSDDVTVMKVKDNGSQIMSCQMESVTLLKTKDSLDGNFAAGGDAETSDLSGDKSSLKLNSDEIFADENEEAEENIISSSPLKKGNLNALYLKKKKRDC